jgi:hypothetical protein
MSEKFKEGDRVKFSREGLTYFATNKRVLSERLGTVMLVKRENPTILWDGLKWPSGPYHPDFIEKVFS